MWNGSPRAAASIATRGARRHSLVAARPVDDVGPQPDRRHAAARPGRPGPSLRRRASRRRTASPAGYRRTPARGGVVSGVDGGRARVRDVRDPPEPPRDGVEDVDRARDVDLHPERRVGADGRDLQRGEVDDAGDLVLVEDGLELREIGDVALDELDPLRVCAEDELEPAPVGAEVEADDGVAVLEHAVGDPGAEAAEDAGDEDLLSQAARPGRRSPSRCRTPSPRGPARAVPRQSP